MLARVVQTELNERHQKYEGAIVLEKWAH